MLQVALRKIFDLENPYDEAKKKLRGSYVEVNGKIVYLADIVSANVVSCSEAEDKPAADVTVKTFNVFMPESGIYPLGEKKGAVLLIKIPKRQWIRSFSYNIYSFTRIDGKVKYSLSDIYENIKNRTDIYVDSKCTIWYWDTKIGKMEKGEAVCTNKLFEQELKDWRKTCQ